MERHEECVSSELYEEFDYSTQIAPQIKSDYVVSKFTFCIPNPSEEDKDGDMVVQRKGEGNKFTITIEHSKRSELPLVGLQIWRGALLLADWLIFNEKTLHHGLILELGSGVGLSSIVAGMLAPVISTDINIGGLLHLIRYNISLNSHIVKYPINVLELDFSKQFSNEIMQILPQVQTIIAADVVYDNRITEAFVRTIQKLIDLPRKRNIYVAMEKRYVFTVAECDLIAPCYEYFVECLRNLKNAVIENVALDFPQYFHYDRVKELVMWKICKNM